MRRRFLACAFAVAGLLGCDSLLFRTGWYASILEPNSSTGLFEMILRNERNAQKLNGDNMILTLGDSRFAYAPRLANELTSSTGYVFRSGGLGGTSPRDWYYMVRDLDPTARRYRAVVIGEPDFNDVDEYYNPAADDRSLHYVIARLRWSDVLEFARSFPTRALQVEAFRDSILKGIVFQTDILAFLAHPKKRIADVRYNRGGFEFWTYTYIETDRSMAGLQIDWSTLHVTFPPDVDQNQRDTLGSQVTEEAPQTGLLTAFRRQWFGRIIDRYRGSPTKIIFLRLPRGPIPRPVDPNKKRSSAIRELASRENVQLLDEHAFEGLERPELFKDAVHLNRYGIARFSAMLAPEIARVLGGRPRP